LFSSDCGGKVFPFHSSLGASAYGYQIAALPFGHYFAAFVATLNHLAEQQADWERVV
jgi:hypothetical protein